MNIARNALFNVLEVIISTLILFITYRLIVNSQGLHSLGVWSLVSATTAIIRLADVGLGAGVGRSIALTYSLSTNNDATQTHNPITLIETAIVSNVLIFSCLSSIAYWPSCFALRHVLRGADLGVALDLLPYSLAVIVGGCVTAVTGASLTSLDRSDQRSIFAIIGTLIQCLVTMILIGNYGLKAVALSQILQGIFVSVASWVAISCRLGSKRSRSYIGERIAEIRPLFSYGLKLQGLSIASALHEPAVKYVLTSTGGITALGLFEFAFRLITQLRQLIASPSQNFLPLFIRARNGTNWPDQYKLACAAMWSVGTLGFLCLIVVTPLISYLWLGKYNKDLFLYVVVLCCGWLLNVIAIPAFYIGLSTGRLRWNIVGSAATTILAVVCGWPMGLIFGKIGVVFSAAFAIGLGGIIILIGNARHAEVPILPGIADFRSLLKTFHNKSVNA